MMMDDQSPASPEKQAPSNKAPDDSRVRDYLASERTMLDWSRTGVAVMALGFVVARFGLVLLDGHPVLASAWQLFCCWPECCWQFISCLLGESLPIRLSAR
jgi:uncharacterized membrane protein YidH (DUF202 family)